MQHTVTITIPERLEPQIRNIRDFNTFVSIITIEALQGRDKSAEQQQLAEAARLMLDEYTHNPELTSFTARDVKKFPPSQLEPPDTPSVYAGKPLSLDDMERAISVEAGKHT